MCCTYLQDSPQEGIRPCSTPGLVVAVWANPLKTILYHKQHGTVSPSLHLELAPPWQSCFWLSALLAHNSPPGESMDRELILKNKARTLSWQGT